MLCQSTIVGAAMLVKIFKIDFFVRRLGEQLGRSRPTLFLLFEIPITHIFVKVAWLCLVCKNLSFKILDLLLLKNQFLQKLVN